MSGELKECLVGLTGGDGGLYRCLSGSPALDKRIIRVMQMCYGGKSASVCAQAGRGLTDAEPQGRRKDEEGAGEAAEFVERDDTCSEYQFLRYGSLRKVSALVYLRGTQTHSNTVPQLDPTPLLQIPRLDLVHFLPSDPGPNPKHTKEIQHPIASFCRSQAEAVSAVVLEGKTAVEVGRVKGSDEEDWREDVGEEGAGRRRGRGEAEELGGCHELYIYQ